MASEIVLIGEVLSAILVMGSFITGIWKMFRRLDHFQDTLNYNTKETLKLIIINEHIPIEERIEAGERYIALGGNGSIKKIVNSLTDKLAEQYIED